MHHCFAVVWRRSLELNPCRIKFIKNQGVTLWQLRRRRVRRRNRRAREVRLEHREILIRQAAGPEFGRFRLCCSKKQSGCTVAGPMAILECPEWRGPAAATPTSAALRRNWKSAEVDHRVPLFRVWSEYRDMPWPKLLDFWGCQISRSSIATSTPQNVPTRRRTDERHAFLKLN